MQDKSNPGSFVFQGDINSITSRLILRVATELAEAPFNIKTVFQGLRSRYWDKNVVRPAAST